jgi:hypothetical protein
LLRLNFRSMRGDVATPAVAACFRFCSDGTLRAPDNYIVGTRSHGSWKIGGRQHREIDCEGPVRVRMRLTARSAPVFFGPFAELHSVGGVLYGDNTCLDLHIPAAEHGPDLQCHELTLLAGESA